MGWHLWIIEKRNYPSRVLYLENFFQKMKWNKDFSYLKLKNRGNADTDPAVKFSDNGCRNSTIISAVIIKNLDFTHGPVPMGYISEASDKDTDLAAIKNGKIRFPKSWYETLGSNQDYVGLPRWLSGKESICSAGDTGDVGSIPGSGRSSGGENGNPLHYSFLG